MQAEDNGHGAVLPSPPSLRELAELALRCGLNPLPPRQDGTKAPLSIRTETGNWSWKPFQERRTTDQEIKGWYGKNRGLGLVCGSISRNLELFEFDEEKTYFTFKDLARQHGLGELVDTIEAGYLEKTPGGGYHWLYLTEKSLPSTKLASRHKTEDELTAKDLAAMEAGTVDASGAWPVKTLIETKGEGGFVVIAPSSGPVHPSRRPYALLSGGLATIATIPAAARDALWELARTFDQETGTGTEARAGAGAGTVQELPTPAYESPHRSNDDDDDDDDRLMPGTDFNRRADWIKDVLPVWTHVFSRGGVIYLRRPGKSKGVSATINYGGHDRLKVFSTSTRFQVGPGKTYTKFAAYALLHHGGDFSAAVSALGKLGYGDQGKPRTKPKKKAGVAIANVTPQGIGLAAGVEARGEPRVPDGAREPGDDREDEVPPPARQLTDIGNGERFADQNGTECRYVYPWKHWLVWDGRRWNRDSTAEIQRMAKRTVRNIYREALADGLEPKVRDELFRWARRSENRTRVEAMIAMAASELPIPALPETFDQEPFLLNCPNGTVDLRTGQLRPHIQCEMLTQLCPTEYHPGAACPLWEAFISGVLAGNSVLIEYLQQICGISLTGHVVEQILPILHGKGANGKSTFITAMMGMMGPDYAIKAPPRLLMRRSAESHPTELAVLHGKRLAVAVETEENAKLNETMVKELTGSDPITARRMKEDFWMFWPTHKVWMVTNHMPRIEGQDHAIWRRIKKIPFDVIIPEARQDADLSRKLEREHEGILAWCVRGCLDWQRTGRLVTPSEVESATSEYKKNEDIIQAFFDEWCFISDQPGIMVRASELHRYYTQYCLRCNETPMSMMRFGMTITDRGFKKHENKGIWYDGIAVHPSRRPDDRDHSDRGSQPTRGDDEP